VVIRISFLDFKRLKAGEKMSSSHNKSPQAIASKKPVFTVEASQCRSSVTAEKQPEGKGRMGRTCYSIYRQAIHTKINISGDCPGFFQRR